MDRVQGPGQHQHQQPQPPRGKQSRRYRGSRSAAAAAAPAAASLLPLVLLLGVASASHGPDLPTNFRVLHANVILRHGERTRLVKATGGTDEFGVSENVVVSQVVLRVSVVSAGVIYLKKSFVCTAVSRTQELFPCRHRRVRLR